MKKALCGDIGGTHASLCIATLDNKISINSQSKFDTQAYDHFPSLISDYLNKVNEKPDFACFAAAGPVQGQKVEMTNAGLVIDAKQLEKELQFQKVLVLNDFDAIGYAVNVLENDDCMELCRGEPQQEGVKGAIGAGTGLGKCILIYDQERKYYHPYSSEGGHADLPILKKEEEIFIADLPHPTYEDLLSGRGLEHIYRCLQRKGYPGEKKDLNAKTISERRRSNALCAESFKWFVKFYARCARNFSLDILPAGGLYIGGGIAAGNSDMFSSDFVEEFTHHPLEKYQDFLENISITIITNYAISLKGAAFALQSHLYRNSLSI